MNHGTDDAAAPVGIPELVVALRCNATANGGSDLPPAGASSTTVPVAIPNRVGPLSPATRSTLALMAFSTQRDGRLWRMRPRATQPAFRAVDEQRPASSQPYRTARLNAARATR
jgi:hypothetical protein